GPESLVELIGHGGLLRPRGRREKTGRGEPPPPCAQQKRKDFALPGLGDKNRLMTPASRLCMGRKTLALRRPPGELASSPMTLDFGINTGFVEELYAQYLENPAAVDPSWRSHFDERLAATSGRPRIALTGVHDRLPLSNGELALSLERTFPQVYARGL